MVGDLRTDNFDIPFSKFHSNFFLWKSWKPLRHDSLYKSNGFVPTKRHSDAEPFTSYYIPARASPNSPQLVWMAAEGDAEYSRTDDADERCRKQNFNWTSYLTANLDKLLNGRIETETRECHRVASTSRAYYL